MAGNGMVRPCSCPHQQVMLGWGECQTEHRHVQQTIATMGIDIGKNSFHVVGLDRRGAIVLRQKW
jgi:hypothetical protein